MIVPGDQGHRFVIHDRDTIYSEGVDRTLEAMGLAILETPPRVPQANTFCERLIGTIRRECLDFVIPMTERHLRAILREWIRHYNRGRPHSSLGPGIPEGPPLNEHNAASWRHRLAEGVSLRHRSSLGCITNIVWSRRRREVRSSIFAEDRRLTTNRNFDQELTSRSRDTTIVD
jgi:putative transposase